ncbi:MAG: hypothetical protein ACLUR5_15755 [Eubacterium ventriosum]
MEYLLRYIGVGEQIDDLQKFRFTSVCSEALFEENGEDIQQATLNLRGRFRNKSKRKWHNGRETYFKRNLRKLVK